MKFSLVLAQKRARYLTKVKITSLLSQIINFKQVLWTTWLREHHQPKQLLSQLFINLNQTLVDDTPFSINIFFFPYRLTLHIAFICVQTNSRFAPRGMYIIVESVPLNKDPCIKMHILFGIASSRNIKRNTLLSFKNISLVIRIKCYISVNS